MRAGHGAARKRVGVRGRGSELCLRLSELRQVGQARGEVSDENRRCYDCNLLRTSRQPDVSPKTRLRSEAIRRPSGRSVTVSVMTTVEGAGY